MASLNHPNICSLHNIGPKARLENPAQSQQSTTSSASPGSLRHYRNGLTAQTNPTGIQPSAGNPRQLCRSPHESPSAMPVHCRPPRAQQAQPHALRPGQFDAKIDALVAWVLAAAFAACLAVCPANPADTLTVNKLVQLIQSCTASPRLKAAIPISNSPITLKPSMIMRNSSHSITRITCARGGTFMPASVSTAVR